MSSGWGKPFQQETRNATSCHGSTYMMLSLDGLQQLMVDRTLP
jgi:hypothetical protein